MVCPDRLVKRNLTCALTVDCSAARGSCTKFCPALEPPGGNAPVMEYFKASMIVVLSKFIMKRWATMGIRTKKSFMTGCTIMTYFPQPFAPAMTVKGKKNSTTCSSSFGAKDLTPRIANRFTLAMLIDCPYDTIEYVLNTSICKDRSWCNRQLLFVCQQQWERCVRCFSLSRVNFETRRKNKTRKILLFVPSTRVPRPERSFQFSLNVYGPRSPSEYY